MEQEVYITGVSAKVTSRCNFRCGHCALGEHTNKYPMDMSPEDAEVIMEAANGPFERFRQERDDFLDGLSKEERAEMERRGELTAVLDRRFLNSGLTSRVPISVEVFTNGFGMRSPEAVAQISQELASHGVDHITVSLDLPHREFTQEHNIPIDYAFLENLADWSKTEEVKKEAGIPEEIMFIGAGNAQYVVPVGRARDFSWQQRVAMAGRGEVKDKVYAKVAIIQKELDEEFDNWPKQDMYSHVCYCSPARFRRGFEETKSLPAENRIRKAGMLVEPNLDVNPCGFSILPPIGNLREQSVEEIHQAAADSELYKIIDEEGPQGLARRLTDKPEEELRAAFIERTPCGLCEDLAREYPGEIKAMLKARAR